RGCASPRARWIGCGRRGTRTRCAANSSKRMRAMSDAPRENFKLFIVILDQPQLVDDLLTGFLDVGVQGATVIESKGMGQIIRQEMPIFAGLLGLFGESTGSRLVMSVMPESLVAPVFKLVEEVV